MSETPPPGFTTTLRAAVNGGALGGLVLGLADGVVSVVDVGMPGSALETAGCFAAAALLYGLFHAALQLAGAPLVHAFVKRRSGGVRYRVAFGLALGVGLFFELYWWTRPLLFYGKPAASPERLAVAAGALVVGLLVGWQLARFWTKLPRGFHLGTRVAIPLLWLGGVLALVADATEPDAPGRINERNRDRPNVLLFVVDALRQDTIGAYGHPVVTTPAIDELAREGVLFERANVQAPFTWTSFGSWLTGKYPRRHGLVKMAPGVRMRRNVTLAWHLKEAGFADGSGALQPEDYACAAFLTGTMTNGSGLIRGFDYYSEAMEGHGLTRVSSAWSTFRSGLLLFVLKTKLTSKVDYSGAAQVAKDWFEENADRRFCALVHLYSTHTPYDPDDRFRHYCDPAYDGPIDAFYAEHRYAIEQKKYPATPEDEARFPADKEQIKHLYYGGVSQADAAIGEIVELLRRKGVLDDTIVIVTSDHGEDLGEGERWEHNHMYQTNLYVPWIMRWPEGLPKDTRVDAIVDSIDLVPTLCDLIGIEVPHDPSDEGGRGVVDGVSLLPLVRGEVGSVREYTFAENGRFVSIHDGAWKLVVAHEVLPADGWARMLAGEEGFPRPRLFDLAADPAEEANLFGERPDELARLVAELRAYSERMPIPLSDVVRSDRDLENQMNDLGYAGDEFE